MGRKQSIITLSKEDREHMEAQVRARTSQEQTVTRANALLLKSDGKTVDEIAENLDINRKSALLCREKNEDGSITSPPKPEGETVIRDYEYRRLGMFSLLAGNDLQSGEAIPLIRESHNSADYIDFLKILDAMYPKKDKIRLMLDNLKVHTSEVTKEYLAMVPGRFEFVYTSKHGSLINMVEGFFSKMTKQMLRGIRVRSRQEFADRIYKYFEEVYADQVAFHRNYKMDDIDVSEEPHVEILLPA